jgi:hypothetical protein
MDLTLIIIVFFWSSEAVVTGGTAGGDNQPLIIIVDRLRYADDHPFATRQPDFRGERFTTQGKPPTMKSLLIPVGLALALVAATAAAPAQASGCLKGAAIGGVVGRYAGHHGLLGAGVGCLIGGHEAHKRDRERAEQGHGSSCSDRRHSYRDGYNNRGYGSRYYDEGR